jgi:hypothetical protein
MTMLAVASSTAAAATRSNDRHSIVTVRMSKCADRGVLKKDLPEAASRARI